MPLETKPDSIEYGDSHVENQPLMEHFDIVKDRETAVENKIDGIANSIPVEKINTPEGIKFLESVAKARKSLTTLAASTILLLASNSQAFAYDNDTEKLFDGSKQTLEIEKTKAPSTSNLAPEVKIVIDVAETVIKSKIEEAKENIKTLGSEGANQEEKIDAAVGIVTTVPSQLIGKSNPLLSVLGELNDLRKELTSDSKSAESVAKKIGMLFFGVATKGIGPLVYNNFFGNDKPQDTAREAEKSVFTQADIPDSQGKPL